ncbi:cytochrome P450 [Ideonella sp. BN130291]|uniref:cytochrome P450 n=1 Tax=Ideonella sp. BN130291 TaxID=3112940 RepID=UPI002E267A80|nr:cytochrome P450 [Ideonella sp. BN130291]
MTHQPCTLATACWHPDPYPFYADLRARHPDGLFFDEEQALWVACSAAAVDAALQAPELVVRPPAEAVPRALRGRPSGQVFGGLMRMNEGQAHQQPKAEALPFLARLEAALPAAVQQVMAAGFSPRRQPIDELLFDAPLGLLAALLGLPAGQWRPTARAVRRLVAAWSPMADHAAHHAGDAAANELLAAFDGQVNRIGFFTQTCDATAGLIGNALVAWQRDAAAAFDVPWLQDTARQDPAVQNTRRWATAPVRLCGQALQPGDAMLVLLASANHDTVAPQSGFGWGRGRHACPGERLSQAMAIALLRAWRDEDEHGLHQFTARWHYRPSPNARIPRFDQGA